jgi:hypothetical protein
MRTDPQRVSPQPGKSGAVALAGRLPAQPCGMHNAKVPGPLVAPRPLAASAAGAPRSVTAAPAVRPPMGVTSVQSKMSSAGGRSGAPPVYRPVTALPTVQPQMARHSSAPVAAPPVYRPQQRAAATAPVRSQAPGVTTPTSLPRPLQTPPAYIPQQHIVTPRFTSNHLRVAAVPVRHAAIQRVTYKGMLYAPGNVDEQTVFIGLAKTDMEAAGTWAASRSEAYIKEIGRTEAVLVDPQALALAEQGRWKGYDAAVNQDLTAINGALTTIGTKMAELVVLLPGVTAGDNSASINAVVLAIDTAIRTIPSKWNIEAKTGFGSVRVAVDNVLRMEPWKDLSGDIGAANAIILDPTTGKSAKKNAEKRKKELGELPAKIATKKKLAEDAAGKRPTIPDRIKEALRKSAAHQYNRGLNAPTSTKSRMNHNKQYLGEIATTEKIKDAGGVKAERVLWASPWSPGVNAAFLEGGTSNSNVFKLRTPIPDDLKNFLKTGDMVGFKAAVKDKTDSKFYPFWNSLEVPGRFTIYTDEIAYLLNKGYRLYEVRRKGGALQQMMVAPGKLDEVKLAYDGRPAL